MVALAAEAVKSSTLSLQSVHHFHSSDGLSLGVLGIGDSITYDVLEEHFQHPACLFVDQSWDSFNSTTACQSSDCRLGDALDVVSKDFSVSLGASFSQTFASFSSSWHLDLTFFDNCWWLSVFVFERVSGSHVINNYFANRKGTTLFRTNCVLSCKTMRLLLINIHDPDPAVAIKTQSFLLACIQIDW